MNKCKDIPNKDSFVEGRELESLIELKQLNTFWGNVCVKRQWMNVWSMESSSPQYKQSLSCLIPNRHSSFVVITILCRGMISCAADHAWKWTADLLQAFWRASKFNYIFPDIFIPFKTFFLQPERIPRGWVGIAKWELNRPNAMQCCWGRNFKFTSPRQVIP